MFKEVGLGEGLIDDGSYPREKGWSTDRAKAVELSALKTPDVVGFGFLILS